MNPSFVGEAAARMGSGASRSRGADLGVRRRVGGQLLGDDKKRADSMKSTRFPARTESGAGPLECRCSFVREGGHAGQVFALE